MAHRSVGPIETERRARGIYRALLWFAIPGAALALGCASSNGGPVVTDNQPDAISLECSLKAPATGRVGDPVKVSFHLQNRATQPVYVLTWRTPLEGLFGNDWSITHGGAEIPYQGPMVKRGDPAEDDYVAIAPGAAADAEVEVSLAYEMREPGRYRIALRGPLMDATTNKTEVPRPLAQQKAVPISCPAVEIELTQP
jgi:hypothetical protein